VVGVRVGVGVAVTVGVAVGDGIGVKVGRGVRVGARVGSGVGVSPHALSSISNNSASADAATAPAGRRSDAALSIVFMP